MAYILLFSLFAQVRKSQGSGLLRLKMKGTKLKNVEGMFSKSDPFFEVSRKVNAAGAQTWDNVFRSDFVKNNLNPDWKEAVLDIGILCGGDLDLPIKVQVYDHESSGNHTFMGDFEMSVNGFKAAAQRNEGIKLKKKGKDTGTINIEKADVAGVSEIAEITQRVAATSVSTPAGAATFVPAAHGGASFIDYVSGGCELNVAIAIDFTGSNGDPRKPGTLHHLNTDGSRNDYEKAIAAIVTLLAKYDSDKMFPVYG